MQRLEIGNDGRPTYLSTREVQKGESVIDLTLATRPIAKWSILAYDPATGSEHDVSELEAGVARKEEAVHEMVVG